MATPIEDYAILADGHTSALVSREGDIDWLCVPFLDSPACFAALLGAEDHGRWSLTIDGGTVEERAYLEATFILCTTYSSPTGTAVVTEWMTIRGDGPVLVRQVRCTAGWVGVHHDLRIRLDYGARVPWAHRDTDPDGRHVLRFIAGPDALTLHGSHLPHGHEHQHEDALRLEEGEELTLTLTWSKSWEPIPTRIDVDADLVNTRAYWHDWCSRPDLSGVVRRSLLVLQALTDRNTGGIAAAVTTSLPEEFGGVRNWDYRYCWLRDSALTLGALLEFGFVDEAHRWRDWLLRAVAGDAKDLQIMYGLDGRRDLPERSLDHLPGYAGSRPVRVGNAAYTQVQHDIFGEVLGALAHARAEGVRETADSWALQRYLASEVCRMWREPDHGIWEIRGEKKHFTHSKLMCWYALDSVIAAIDEHGLAGPRQEWVHQRDEIRRDILAHGVDPATGAFVQHYGTDAVDASLLMMLSTGFLPHDDPRVVATVDRILAELSDGPHVKRYLTDSGVDGLPGTEHHFYACSFWLVDALAKIGRTSQARDRFEELLATSSTMGLFAEEYDVSGRRFAGNYPQAFSHLALLQAASTLEELEGATKVS